jgi:diamine N-acetyltransferase
VSFRAKLRNLSGIYIEAERSLEFARDDGLSILPVHYLTFRYNNSVPAEIDFHPATETDLDRLLIYIDEYYRYDGLAFNHDKAANALKMLLKDPSLGQAWLIRQGSDEMGYIILTFGFILEFHGRHAVIDEVYIREKYRGKGVGKQALAFIEQYCQSKDIQAIRLEVEDKNAYAADLYRRCDFEAHNRIVMTKVLYERL